MNAFKLRLIIKKLIKNKTTNLNLYRSFQKYDFLQIRKFSVNNTILFNENANVYVKFETGLVGILFN